MTEKSPTLLKIASEVHTRIKNDQWKQAFQKQIGKFIEMFDARARALAERRMWTWHGQYWGPEIPLDPTNWFYIPDKIGELTENEQERAPNGEEELMIAYVWLAVIHNGTLTKKKPIGFNNTDKGKPRHFRACDEWAMNIYMSLNSGFCENRFVGHSTIRRADGHETRKMLLNAFRDVWTDLEKTEVIEIDPKHFSNTKTWRLLERIINCQPDKRVRFSPLSRIHTLRNRLKRAAGDYNEPGYIELAKKIKTKNGEAWSEIPREKIKIL